MKTLVTGGTGFVGSHLIEALRASGDSVRALVRPGSDRDLVTRLGAEPVTGQLEDIESLKAACRGVDVVYHSAARVEIIGDYADFHETTVLGTQRLIAAAGHVGVPRFVYVSSCGVYHPKLMTERPITERTPTPPPPKWFVYGRAKLAAEEAVRRDVAPPMEWVVVRLGYLYGPRNRAMHRYLRPFITGGQVMLIGDGSNEMAMLYVGDAARALAAAGRTPAAAGQTLIAAGNERVTQRDYLNALARGFGVPAPTRRVPYRLAFAAAWLAEYLLWFSRGDARVAINRSAIALTGLPQRIDGSHTQQLLGWKPQVRFADGIQRAFDWYDREYGNAELQAAATRS